MLTFEQLRKREKLMEVSHLGPGTYFGNNITFGSSTSSIKFSPGRKMFSPQIGNNESQRRFRTDRGHNFIGAKDPTTMSMPATIMEY